MQEDYFKKLQSYSPDGVFGRIKDFFNPPAPESATSPGKVSEAPVTVVDPMKPPAPTQTTAFPPEVNPNDYNPPVAASGNRPAYAVKKQTWGDLGNMIADFTIRPISRAAVSIAQDFTGDKEFQPKTGLEKTFFGDEPVKAFSERQKSGSEMLQKFGVPEGAAGPLSFAGVAGMTALDVIPGLPGKNLAKKLAAETAEDVVKTILSKEVKNLTPEAIDRITPLIAKETSPAAVKQIINEEAARGVSAAANTAEKGSVNAAESGSANAAEQTVASTETKNIQDTAASTNTDLNTKRFQVEDSAKKFIEDEVTKIRPQIEAKIGAPLTNAEVRTYADNTSKIMDDTVGREETKQYLASLTKVNDRIALAAKTGTVDEQFIKDLQVAKTHATEAGRLLQAQKMGAIPVESQSAKQIIVGAVLDSGKNIDEILEAAKNVDFNDANQASDFYRKFVAPKTQEWFDLVRYNSMLSSPLTHSKNFFSNAVNSTLIPVVEKALVGGFDFLKSGVTGSARTEYATEALKYLQGYAKSIKPAFQKFVDVMRGKSAMTNLDLLKEMPLANTGLKGTISKFLSAPMRALEGSDQFFRELVQSGEESALNYRKELGGKVMTADGAKDIANVNIPDMASDKAAYRLYRQDLFQEGQGKVLDAVDQLTSKLMSLRNNPNKLISVPARLTIPFVKTPMNIFKQGIEYSPLGFATAMGNADKRLQFAKATMGSAVAAGTAMLIGAGRLTGAEPTNETEKTLWREAGKQPYSVKIGNKWVSYQYLNPAIAFNMATISIIDQMIKEKKADQDTADVILGSVSKYANYLADQSYFKSFGDLLNAVSGGESSASQLISNYPQQLIPYRALGGWFSRLTDDYQRKVDKDASFVDKQVQSLMMNIPGLTEMVPAREGHDGKPVENKNKLFNAFSPIKVTEEDPTAAKFLSNYEDLKKGTSEQTAQDKKFKEGVQPKYDEIQKLNKAGDTKGAKKILSNLSDEEYKAYQSIKRSANTKDLNTQEVDTLSVYNEVQDLLMAGKKKDAYKRLNALSDEEYKAYKGIKAKLE